MCFYRNKHLDQPPPPTLEKFDPLWIQFWRLENSLDDVFWVLSLFICFSKDSEGIPFFQGGGVQCFFLKKHISLKMLGGGVRIPYPPSRSAHANLGVFMLNYLFQDLMFFWLSVRRALQDLMFFWLSVRRSLQDLMFFWLSVRRSLHDLMFFWLSVRRALQDLMFFWLSVRRALQDLMFLWLSVRRALQDLMFLWLSVRRALQDPMFFWLSVFWSSWICVTGTSNTPKQWFPRVKDF